MATCTDVKWETVTRRPASCAAFGESAWRHLRAYVFMTWCDMLGAPVSLRRLKFCLFSCLFTCVPKKWLKDFLKMQMKLTNCRDFPCGSCFLPLHHTLHLRWLGGADLPCWHYCRCFNFFYLLYLSTLWTFHPQMAVLDAGYSKWANNCTTAFLVYFWFIPDTRETCNLCTPSKSQTQIFCD